MLCVLRLLYCTAPEDGWRGCTCRLTCAVLRPLCCNVLCCVQPEKIDGVVVMSPEVREMQKTLVNDDLCE